MTPTSVLGFQVPGYISRPFAKSLSRQVEMLVFSPCPRVTVSPRHAVFDCFPLFPVVRTDTPRKYSACSARKDGLPR